MWVWGFYGFDGFASLCEASAEAISISSAISSRNHSCLAEARLEGAGLEAYGALAYEVLGLLVEGLWVVRVMWVYFLFRQWRVFSHGWTQIYTDCICMGFMGRWVFARLQPKQSPYFGHQFYGALV